MHGISVSARLSKEKIIEKLLSLKKNNEQPGGKSVEIPGKNDLKKLNKDELVNMYTKYR
jgi:hypothetical protein